MVPPPIFPGLEDVGAHSIFAEGFADTPRAVSETSTPRQDVGILDEEVFPAFAPMLAACQEYARLRGCRFRWEDFRGLGLAVDECSFVAEGPVPVSMGQDPASAGRSLDSSLLAKLSAAAAVAEYSVRLRAGEPPLLEELGQAFRTLMAESARTLMITTFQTLELWPPLFSTEGAASEDCNYQDLSAPLPVIARRAYNDHTLRVGDLASSLQRPTRRARTASFLVDIAQRVGVVLPSSQAAEQEFLELFQTRVAEWQESVRLAEAAERDQEFLSGEELAEPEDEDGSPLEGLIDGLASPLRRRADKAKSWWAESSPRFWGSVGAIAEVLTPRSRRLSQEIQEGYVAA